MYKYLLFNYYKLIMYNMNTIVIYLQCYYNLVNIH